MQWYLKVLKNYVTFSGRARRKEFWMFNLINFLIVLALSVVELVLEIPAFLSGIYSLAIILPSLAVTVRRLHDIGKSGWWILISLVPLVGAIILLVFECLDSVPDNQYGPNPKSGAASDIAI
ncbi:DUF805 domain-containing protein [Jeotgalibacillus aurantiacus]|uniref:DUF805 domain-containing protein n=1 Tax=Jeotgalibacillus aurantiacus TaxID=2763266 RepID=UPI001D0B27A7|nr:DUF805 domain-containing protein [Jeotgalibacillus aurantiacus]